MTSQVFKEGTRLHFLCYFTCSCSIRYLIKLAGVEDHLPSRTTRMTSRPSCRYFYFSSNCCSGCFSISTNFGSESFLGARSELGFVSIQVAFLSRSPLDSVACRAHVILLMQETLPRWQRSGRLCHLFATNFALTFIKSCEGGQTQIAGGLCCVFHCKRSVWSCGLNSVFKRRKKNHNPEQPELPNRLFLSQTPS